MQDPTTPPHFVPTTEASGKSFTLDDSVVHTRWGDPGQARLTVATGDRVTVTCRDGFDQQVIEALQLPRPPGTTIYETIDFSRVAPLTGPIGVQGAAPGDCVEVYVEELTPFGTANTVIAPDWYDVDFLHRGDRAEFPDEWIRTFDMERAVADGFVPFSDNIALPLRPMLGMVGTAPAAGTFTTGPPRAFGGNLDIQDVGVGASVFLPVNRPGALVSVGDGHAIQGDGEVCGTTVETPIRAGLRFVHHPGLRLDGPVVATPDAVMLVGYGATVDDAARHALRRAVKYLAGVCGLDDYEAYALASCACDVRINQVVNAPHLGARVVIPRGLLPAAPVATD